MSSFPSLTPAEQHALSDRFGDFPENAEGLGLRNSFVALSSGGRIVGFTVHNTNASAQYVWMFDANGVPANGAVNGMCFKVAGNDNLYVQWIPWRTFRSGCVLVNSSTDTSLTIGSADCLFDVQYA